MNSPISIEFSDKDIERLQSKLSELSGPRYEAACKLAAADIYNRGKNGGTPVQSGELRVSLNMSGTTVGYSASYAPHVEFGHRIVRNGSQVGYVPGKNFFQRNVDTEAPIFKDLLAEQIRKVING